MKVPGGNSRRFFFTRPGITKLNSNLSRIGVGIDTARYGHHVTFLDENKKTAATAFHFKEDNQGYQRLRSALLKLRQKHPEARLLIRVDAAGQYASNLIHWLHQQKDLAVSISVGTPKGNKRYRETFYDKRKADPVESLACARFAVAELPEPMYVPDPAFGTLRIVASALEANATNLTRLVNQLHMLLAVAFPEFAVVILNISCGYALKILEKYPTAKRLSNARIDSLLAMPHLREDLARRLHENAKVTTAHATDTTMEELIKNKVSEIRAAKANAAKLLKMLKNSWDSLPDGPHRRVHSIKGIGIQTAAALAAKIVSIDRFETDSALIGYFGIFPEERNTSGTTRDGQPKVGTTFRMSAKGNDLVRRLLYTAAQSAAKHNPAVRDLFARQMARGKKYETAIGHCMAKLLRQVHAVWTKNEDYDRNFETKQAEQENEKVVGLKADEPPSKETDESLVAQPVVGKPLDFAALKSQISIVDILHHHSWQETVSKGDQLRGPCPIHQGDSNRSFAVNTQKNVYSCHSCGAKGNSLDLLVALSEQTLLEAAWSWIQQTGIEPVLLNAPKKRKAAKQASA